MTAEAGKRSPSPDSSLSVLSSEQKPISTFFAGRAPASKPSDQHSNTRHKPDGPQHADASTSTKLAGRDSVLEGTYPLDGTLDITGSSRSPPPKQVMLNLSNNAAQRGRKHSGSLGEFRTPVLPSLMPMPLLYPHNLCYVNSVLHMMHQAGSLTGPITGLGALNGAFMQAARSSQPANIARGPAWSFMWPGWQRPTRQHDAADFLQHLCQHTERTGLRGGWEARKNRAGAYEVLDEQFTCPHVRLPLRRPFQVQAAVQQWHDQDVTHALRILRSSWYCRSTGSYTQTAGSKRRGRASNCRGA